MGSKRKKKMRVKYSISLKITLIIVLLSSSVIISLGYITTMEESKILDLSSSKASDEFVRSLGILTLLDEGVKLYANDSNQLNSHITNISQNYSQVKQISIIKPTSDGLRINISTNEELVGTVPGGNHSESYRNGTYFYTFDDKKPVLTVISPINISGKTLGTYEIVISPNMGIISIDSQIKNMVIFSFTSILVLIISLLFLLRRFFVNPIIAFRDAAKVIGEGKLDRHIDIHSSDELGELADAFNQMTHDLKKSREKIEQYSKTLERLLKQKDEFIGQLGHDLKNPLTPLVGLLPMIISKEKDQKNKEQLEIIHENVLYMKDLIFKTLQLARLRSEKTKFDFETLDLNEQLEKVLKSQSLFLQEHNIKTKNNIKEGVLVWADKLRLSEVFKNLITNSVKYTDEGGGKITFDAEEEEDMVTVMLTDTGIGMTKKQQELIFDEFYKADESRHSLDSSGLGLSICKRIVKKHDGDIWVKSPGPGKGSTFYFTLKKSDKT